MARPKGYDRDAVLVAVAGARGRGSQVRAAGGGVPSLDPST